MKLIINMDNYHRNRLLMVTAILLASALFIISWHLGILSISIAYSFIWLIVLGSAADYLFLTRIPPPFDKNEPREPSSKSGIGLTKRELELLIAEYEACQSALHHYDGTRWLIGSIFIASSFTLFGFSFAQGLDSRSIGLLGTASIALWLIFLYYDQHVQIWVSTSIKRSVEIESKLGAKLGWLIHTKSNPHISAFWMMILLTILIPGFWIVRILWM